MQVSGLISASLVLALSVGLGTPMAAAQGRPDVRRMTCEEARQLISDAGGIVVTTGTHTYERYVADRRFCEPWEHYLKQAFTPTADNRSCRIGYTCQDWDPYFRDD